jgi:hypothetical protein
LWYTGAGKPNGEFPKFDLEQTCGNHRETPNHNVDKIIPAIFGEKSMGLFTTHLEKEGYQYPFLIDTGASVSAMKPGTSKGQRVDPQEFTVKDVIGMEFQTSGSRKLEFRLGRCFYRYKLIKASVQIEYSSILGPDFPTV